VDSHLHSLSCPKNIICLVLVYSEVVCSFPCCLSKVFSASCAFLAVVISYAYISTDYTNLYIRMSDDFMSVLQERIPEAISSQKCHRNIGLIFYGYEVMVIWQIIPTLRHNPQDHHVERNTNLTISVTNLSINSVIHCHRRKNSYETTFFISNHGWNNKVCVIPVNFLWIQHVSMALLYPVIVAISWSVPDRNIADIFVCAK
jgi:hypothetical protein